MNNIGFGIFCFGEEYYYKGTVEKINNILNGGYHCYILTENTDFFTKKYTPSFVHVFESYSDKMGLPKHVLKNHDICILIDADTHIKDYSFLDDLRHYNFKEGISFIDTLLNHRAKREFVKDLINKDSDEWKRYVDYVTTLYPNYGNLVTMWEYFLVINKNGFNLKEFYHNYERLQLVKEYSDISLKKEVVGAGEGISIQVSGKLSNTNVGMDLELYNLLKNKMVSINKRFINPINQPDWMK
jgi:hypothetical protein